MIVISADKSVLAEPLNSRDILSQPQSYYMCFLVNALVVATHLNAAHRLNTMSSGGRSHLFPSIDRIMIGNCHSMYPQISSTLHYLIDRLRSVAMIRMHVHVSIHSHCISSSPG